MLSNRTIKREKFEQFTDKQATTGLYKKSTHKVSIG